MNAHKARVLVHRMEENSCLGKREYLSLHDARHAASVVGKKIGECLVAHQCLFCRLFHVGHRKSWKRIEGEQRLKTGGYEAAAK